MKRFILALSLFACTKTAEQRPAPKVKGPSEGATVQVALGAGSQPQLPFSITKVHDEAPVEVEGDGWTFFDGALADGTVFTVGMHLGKPVEGLPMSFGKGVLSFRDAESNAQFVEAFGKAFRVTAKRSGGAATKPKPLRFSTAVLGRGVKRHAGGGFGGKGDWIATKLFPAHGDTQGEVFFNYDLTSKKGEFAEKDAAYNQDVADVFAAALR